MRIFICYNGENQIMLTHDRVVNTSIEMCFPDECKVATEYGRFTDRVVFYVGPVAYTLIPTNEYTFDFYEADRLIESGADRYQIRLVLLLIMLGIGSM